MFVTAVLQNSQHFVRELWASVSAETIRLPVAAHRVSAPASAGGQALAPTVVPGLSALLTGLFWAYCPRPSVAMAWRRRRCGRSALRRDL